MEPSAILVVGRPVEEVYLTLVPSLVSLLDVGEVETGDPIGRIGVDLGHSTLVAIAAVRRIGLVPYVYGYLLPLAPTPTRNINGGSQCLLICWREHVLSVDLNNFH